MSINGRPVGADDETLSLVLSAVHIKTDKELEEEKLTKSACDSEFFQYIKKHAPNEPELLLRFQSWSTRHSELWDEFTQHSQEYKDWKAKQPKLIDYSKVREDFTAQLAPIIAAFPQGTTGGKILLSITRWLLLTPELFPDLGNLRTTRTLLQNRIDCLKAGYIPNSLDAPVPKADRKPLAPLAKRRQASGLACIHSVQKLTIEQAKDNLLRSGLANVLPDEELFCECCSIDPDSLKGISNPRVKMHPKN